MCLTEWGTEFFDDPSATKGENKLCLKGGGLKTSGFWDSDDNLMLLMILCIVECASPLTFSHRFAHDLSIRMETHVRRKGVGILSLSVFEDFNHNLSEWRRRGRQGREGRSLAVSYV